MIPCGVRDNNKRDAAMKMLQLSGLIVLRDSTRVYGGREHGVAQKFGLGVNHPCFAQFVALYGNVRDPKGLPCVVAPAAEPVPSAA